MDIRQLPHMIECGHVYIAGCSPRGEVSRLNRSATELFERWLADGIPQERDPREEKLYLMLRNLLEARQALEAAR